MPNAGFKSNILMGQQVAWDTALKSTEILGHIWEVKSLGIRNRGPKATSTRYKNNPSASGLIEMMFHAEGDLGFDAHAENMGIWLLQAMMGSATPTKWNATPVSVLTAATWAASGAKDSLDTQPSATTPACNPCKLIIAFDTNVPAPQVYTGTVVITGTDQNDLPLTETVTFTAEATKTTAFYFKTVDATGITINMTPVNATDTITITGEKNTYSHVIILGDDILEGMTMEILKGTIPSVAVGMLINNFRFDIGDIIGLTFSMMGKRLWNRYKLGTADANPVTSTTGTSTSGFNRPSTDVFPAWGIRLLIDGGATAVGVASGSLSINNNLRFPVRYRGARTEPKPIRGDNREILFTPSIDYDTVNSDFDAKSMANGSVALQMVCACSPYGGAEYLMTFTLPRAQLQDFPDPEVSDYGEVLQELPFRVIRSAGASTSDELTVTIQNTKATYATIS